jgi:membrane-associated phospholipid phosphatase
MINIFDLNIFDFFFRASPLFMNLVMFLLTWILKDHDYLYFFISLVVCDGLNHIVKYNISKPIMGNKKFGIIGTGTRPTGARNCGLFKDNKLSKSYGMPSGHSQGAAIFSTILFLQVNEMFIDEIIKISIQIGLILFALSVMYSRVRYGCHTVQQTIIGGSMGLILGRIIWENRYIF